jgi:hypothetical protein
VKFTAAVVEQVHEELGALGPHPGSPSDVVAIARLDLESACARLEQVREVLRGVVALFYADNDMAHFADGRPVMGRLRMCDGSQYLNPWHPYPFQDAPREIRTVTTRNGTRKRVIVSAPGHLDAVSEFDGCDRPPRVLGGDNRCGLY